MTAIMVPHASHLDEDQIAIVDLLKEALAEALEGNITTIGIVVCMKGGFASVMAGKQAGDLNLGCDDLKQRIRDAVTGSQKTRGASTRLLRGRRMT